MAAGVNEKGRGPRERPERGAGVPARVPAQFRHAPSGAQQEGMVLTQRAAAQDRLYQIWARWRGSANRPDEAGAPMGAGWE